MSIMLATINATNLNLTGTNGVEAINNSMAENTSYKSSKGSKSSGFQYLTVTSGSAAISNYMTEEASYKSSKGSKSSGSHYLRNETSVIDTIVSSGNRTSRDRNNDESEPKFLFPAKAAKFLKEQSSFLNTTTTNSSKSSRSNNNDNDEVTAKSNSGSTSAVRYVVGISTVTGLVGTLIV
jgi:hypothetical protein